MNFRQPEESPPPVHPDLFESLNKAAGAAVAVASGIGRRIMVHAAGLIFAVCSLFISGSGHTAAAFAGVYVGLICLIPREDATPYRWVFATGAGAAQAALLLLLGLPWETVLAWGGAQTWCQRFLQRKGQMGWEFTVLPALCVALGLAVAALNGHGQALWPLASVPLLLPAGYFAYKTHAAMTLQSAYGALRAKALTRLRPLADNPDLPRLLQAPLTELVAHTEEFIRLSPGINAQDAPLIEALERCVQLVALRLTRSGAEGRDETVSDLLRELNMRLADRLLQLAPPAPADPKAAALAGYRESVLSLRRKRETLAEDMRPILDSLCDETERILTCMRRDQGDFAPGDRFLTRYLPAAHQMVDEYARLGREGRNLPAVQEALARCTDLLFRLEKAFAAEHAQLLRNDTIDFAADLNLLDKLLKIKGQ